MVALLAQPRSGASSGAGRVMLLHLARAVCALALAVSAGACGSGGGDAADGPAAAAGAESSAWEVQAVPTPDLSLLPESVQSQVRARFATLAAVSERANAPASELAQAHGDIGLILMATRHHTGAEASLRNAAALAPRDPRSGHGCARFRVRARELPGRARCKLAVLAFAEEAARLELLVLGQLLRSEVGAAGQARLRGARDNLLDGALGGPGAEVLVDEGAAPPALDGVVELRRLRPLRVAHELAQGDPVVLLERHDLDVAVGAANDAAVG